MTKYRKEKVGDLLLHFLAKEINILGDPRFKLLTITSTEVSADLKSAKVYWTMPVIHVDKADAKNALEEISEKEKKDIEEALKDIEKFLKKRIAEELELRYVPKLIFKYDSSVVTGMRIDYLLSKVGF